MHQSTDKEWSFFKWNNKSQIPCECVTKAVFNVFQNKNKRIKKKEVNKEQGKEFSFITVNICCLFWASFMSQWGQYPIWIPADSFYIKHCRFCFPFWPPWLEISYENTLASQFGKTLPLYLVTRYTGLCKARTVSPGETKDNRTFLFHCVPRWQVGQNQSHNIGDVGRWLNPETLSAHTGGGMRVLGDGERPALSPRDIVELSEASSSLTLWQRLCEKAAVGAAVWWGHTVGKRAAPPRSCWSRAGAPRPKCLFQSNFFSYLIVACVGISTESWSSLALAAHDDGGDEHLRWQIMFFCNQRGRGWLVGLEARKALREVGGPKKHVHLLKFFAVSQLANLLFSPWLLPAEILIFHRNCPVTVMMLFTQDWFSKSPCGKHQASDNTPSSHANPCKHSCLENIPKNVLVFASKDLYVVDFHVGFWVEYQIYVHFLIHSGIMENC